MKRFIKGKCNRAIGGELNRKTNTLFGYTRCGGKLKIEDHGDFIYTECTKCGNRTVKDKPLGP